MKILLKILGGRAALALVLVVVSFFMPRTFRVERPVVIKAKPEAVYALVAELKAWKDWGVWYERDPAMVIAYSPATTGAGAWTEWQSKSQGSGKATIKEIAAPTRMVYDLEFKDDGMLSTGSFLITGAEAGAVRISSVMEGDLGMNPIGQLMGPILDKMLGPDFEAGLAKMKRIAEGSAK
ncbi:MAG: SRPBCC family protein [Undibacterium sp.]|nr:SRPBCC family protein [Opitutaceae bacterium]